MSNLVMIDRVPSSYYTCLVLMVQFDTDLSLPFEEMCSMVNRVLRTYYGHDQL